MSEVQRMAHTLETDDDIQGLLQVTSKMLSEVTGLAGLVAGACSMAMGEWLSVTSSRELYASQIATEAEELRQIPEEEKEELVLIYRSKGIDEVQAQALADRLSGDGWPGCLFLAACCCRWACF